MRRETDCLVASSMICFVIKKNSMGIRELKIFSAVLAFCVYTPRNRTYLLVSIFVICAGYVLQRLEVPTWRDYPYYGTFIVLPIFVILLAGKDSSQGETHCSVHLWRFHYNVVLKITLHFLTYLLTALGGSLGEWCSRKNVLPPVFFSVFDVVHCAKGQPRTDVPSCYAAYVTFAGKVLLEFC
jgi:hypothetical protein